MILSRFLKPKWQNADPDTRKQAVQELDSTDPMLGELAQQDPDAEVRCAALSRCNDLQLLQQIAAQEADPRVRLAAEDRYLNVLAEKAVDGPALVDHLAHLQRITRADWVDHLLRHAVDPIVRIALLDRITAEAALAEIACEDSHPDVRLAAFERVYDPQLLEEIARHSRNRDKRLSHRARERLDQQALQNTAATLQRQLCVEMENLQWDGESGQNAGRFPHLEHEWRLQEATAALEWQERYTRARARFLEERQASAHRRTQRLTLAKAVDDLLDRLRKATEPNAELSAAIVCALQETPAAWAALGPVQETEMRRLQERFEQHLEAIREQDRVLQRNATRADRLRDVLRQTEALLRQAGEVREGDLKPMQQRWEGLEQPQSAELTQQLQRQFEGVLDQIRGRLQRQVKQRDKEWEEIQEITARLEQTATEGALQEAMALQEQAREQLNRNIGLTKAQMSAIEDRFQVCAGQIGQLRDWRRWGTHQAREQLCVTAEALIGIAEEPTAIAQRIQQARDAWKALDHQEGAAPKALWRRFHQACERAYAPCQAFFEAQNRERRENLEKKQALCGELEAFAENTDWEQVNWREAERVRRKLQEQWAKIGPINRTDRKAIDRRFDRVWKKLENTFSAERDREIKRRQALIQAVQALAESTKIRVAVDAVKKAQAEWHPTIQAPQRQEQALWKEFRAACDVVFTRRQAEQQALDMDRLGHLSHRQALCAEIEGLIENTSFDQLTQARARVQAIRQVWDAAGAVPRADQRAIEQRFDAALRQFAAQEQVLRQARVHHQFTTLHQRTRDCARLEGLLLEEAPSQTAIAEAHAAWDALPPLPAPWQERMQQRFSTVVQALAAEDATERDALRAQLLENMAQKRVLCVCMEIASGVESPPADAQLRMEHQVARLAASLAGTTAKTHALYNPQALQDRWCVMGALPIEQESMLDARFLRALQAWWQREGS